MVSLNSVQQTAPRAASWAPKVKENIKLLLVVWLMSSLRTHWGCGPQETGAWAHKWEIFILCTGSCKEMFWFIELVTLIMFFCTPYICIHIHTLFVPGFSPVLHWEDTTVTPITSGELLRAKSTVNEWIIKSTVSPLQLLGYMQGSVLRMYLYWIPHCEAIPKQAAREQVLDGCVSVVWCY